MLTGHCFLCLLLLLLLALYFLCGFGFWLGLCVLCLKCSNYVSQFRLFGAIDYR